MVSAGGVLLVDKPGAMTSHDVVARMRRSLATRKIGHAGTLDPLATGLLVLGVGSATRLLQYLVGLDKDYEATIRLGATTISDDSDSEIVQRASPAALAALREPDVAAAIGSLTGDILQTPSAVSAIKVGGRRSYARVRAGESVELPARAVNVARFVAHSFSRGSDYLDVAVSVTVSSGTYVRALARDLGAKLDVGGHLTSLRRTRVGPFKVEEAAAPEAVTNESGALLEAGVAAARVLPVLRVSEKIARDIGHGKKISADLASNEKLVAALDDTGALLAVLRRQGETLAVATGFPAAQGF